MGTVAKGCFGYIILLFVVIMLIGFCSQQGGDDNTGSPGAACYMAQKFVGDRLKAPSTADFESCSRAKVVPTTKGEPGTCYTVVSYVDSQNSFGAKLRSEFVAVVRYDGQDKMTRNYNWELISLSMEGVSTGSRGSCR